MTVRVENLVVNDWLRNKAGNVAIVLHLDIHTDEVILIDTNDAKPLPRSVSARALSDYIKVVDNGATQATELLQTDKERAAAEFALNVIKPLVDDPSIYDRDSRGPLVRARAHECSISKKTVLSYLRRYWLGGMTVNALAPPLSRSWCLIQKLHCHFQGGARAPPRWEPVYPVRLHAQR